MKRVSPKTEMVLADPVGSVLAPLVNTGEMIEAGSWTVEGIGEDFVPPNCDLSLVKAAYSITDQESYAAARDLLAQGRHPRRLVVGHAARRGAALLQAAEQAEARGQLRLRFRHQVSLQGVQRLRSSRRRDGSSARSSATVRDLVINRHEEGGAVEVRPHDTLRTVFARMRAADVSQLPVVENDKIVGLVDESDLLARCSRTPMTPPTASTVGEGRDGDAARDGLGGRADPRPRPLFRKDYVAIVMDDGRFLGLITRIDLINHFRVRHE